MMGRNSYLTDATAARCVLQMDRHFGNYTSWRVLYVTDVNPLCDLHYVTCFSPAPRIILME